MRISAVINGREWHERLDQGFDHDGDIRRRFYHGAARRGADGCGYHSVENAMNLPDPFTIIIIAAAVLIFGVLAYGVGYIF